MKSVAFRASFDCPALCGLVRGTRAAPGPSWARLAVAAAAVLGNGGGLAQAAGSLRIVPTADASLAVVDSSLYSATDVVTTLRPGFQLNTQSGRLRATVDYSLSAVHHSHHDANLGQADSLQNTLNAALNAELYERWIFLDANASVSQQSISAYGQQSVDGVQLNTNRTEVSQLSVRPSVKGQLSDAAVYSLILNANATHANNGTAPGSHATGAELNIASASGASRWGWSGLVTTQQTAYAGGGNPSNDTRVSLSLLVRPDFDLQLSLRGGQETTSVGGAYRQHYNNWGGDLRWTPDNRNSAYLSMDERYFGRSHQFNFEHRMPSSTVRLSSNRDVANGAAATGVGQPVTLYQLLYAQFASLQPDPVLRDQLVRDFLLSIKQDPNAQVSGGFLNGGTTVQRRDDLALSYVGRRTVLTLQAYDSNTRRIDLNATAQQLEPVRQLGLNTAVTYRLTPAANLSLTGSRLRTLDSATQQGNALNSAALAWSEQLNRYLGTSLSARYAVFHGQANPYHETSLSATLSLRF